MRHGNHRFQLGVKKEHRVALMANLAVALILHSRIQTTLAKAKALRPFIEKLITMAKKAALATDPAKKLHYRRLVIAKIRDPKAAAILFDEKVSEFLKRPGGYTRIYKLLQRIGDAAPMALIEFISADDEGYKKKKTSKAVAKKTSPKAKSATSSKVKSTETADEVASATSE